MLLRLLGIVCFGWLSGYAAFAQPALAQSQPIVIQNVIIYVGDGSVIPNGTVAFEKGKLTYVGASANFSAAALPANTTYYDGKGTAHVYPGLIAPTSSLGLIEIESVRATRDIGEVGDYNPNVRALIAYNAESAVIPTVRSNGVLLAQIMPQGNLLPGQSSVMQLDAWNWEDAAFKADDGIVLNFPDLYTTSGWWAEPGDTKVNEHYKNNVRQLRDFFQAARAYAKTTPTPTPLNLKMEAMRGLFEGRKNLYVHAHTAKEISSAVLFAREFDITPVIVGGSDAWMVTDLLKQHHVPVILGATQNLPAREGDDIDQPFKTAAMLQQAGILYCFSNDDRGWQVRNLAFQAGQAVPYGITKAQALSALTLNTARILKIDDRVGSLAVGKDATLFISIGDVMDMRTCVVQQAFIQGRTLNMMDKQKELYERYRQKYKATLKG